MTSVTREEIESEAEAFLIYHAEHSYTLSSRVQQLADLIEKLLQKSSAQCHRESPPDGPDLCMTHGRKISECNSSATDKERRP
jgi:hypothetical protein